MNFYNRFPGDYIKKTLDLSMVEDGAYTRLLDWMYANERPVPHEKRHTITRCQSAGERRAVDAVLNQYFTHNGDGWDHERTLEAIEEARPRIEAAKINGKKGGRPRKQNPEETQQAAAKKPSGLSKNNPEETQSESSPHTTHHSHTPDSSLRSENTHRGDSTGQVRVVSAAGEVCKAMKAHGVFDVNPGNLDLLALLDAGAEVREFAAAAQTAVSKRKGFAYALGIVRKAREDAATAKPLHQGAMPQQAPSRRDVQLQTAGLMTGTTPMPSRQASTTEPETIDVQSRLIAP